MSLRFIVTMHRRKKLLYESLERCKKPLLQPRALVPVRLLSVSVANVVGCPDEDVAEEKK
jgi:hypothetical protein